jgi:hypothetical protein
MAVEHFKAETTIHEKAKQVLLEMMKDNLSLGLVDPNDIIILMREGDMPPKWGLIPGQIKKVTKDLPLLTDKKYNYKYVLVIVAKTWNNMTDEQRNGLLYHLFCHIDVQENENTGDVSYRLKKPPIVAFPEELEKHGYWWPHEDKSDIVKILEELIED